MIDKSDSLSLDCSGKAGGGGKLKAWPDIPELWQKNEERNDKDRERERGRETKRLTDFPRQNF